MNRFNAVQTQPDLKININKYDEEMFMQMNIKNVNFMWQPAQICCLYSGSYSFSYDPYLFTKGEGWNILDVQ